MTTVKYKGFNILARPYQLYDSKRWTVDLEIQRNGGRQPFSLDERYPTEIEADTRCSGLGRRIIDGQVPGWSVEHLRAYKRESVRQLIIAGIGIIGFGAFVLFRGASLPSLHDVLKVSDFMILPDGLQLVPPLVGGAAVVAGIALIVAGMRRRT